MTGGIPEEGGSPGRSATGEAGPRLGYRARARRGPRTLDDAAPPRAPPATLEDQVQRELCQNLRLAAPVLAALYAFFAIAHLFAVAPAVRLQVFLVASATALGLSVLSVWLRRVPLAPARATPVAMGMLSASLANAIVHLALSHQMRQSTNFGLVVLAASLFLPSWRTFVVAALVSTASWVAAVASFAAPLDEVIHYVFLMVTASAVGSLFFAMRRREARAIFDWRAAFGRAERSEKATSEAMKVAAHELRGPLNPLQLGIQSARRLLEKGEPIPPRTLERIEQQSKLLERLIDELLEASRAERGVLHLSIEWLDLAAVVREQADGMARSLGRAIEVEAPREARIQADPLRMRQVVGNLLDNALKYSPSDRPVQVRLGDCERGLRLEVVDFGPGMDPEVQQGLFRMFFRAPQAIAARPGLGLGLYLVREIVRRHGGAISVRSEVGRGSTFTVELPRRLSAGVAAPARPLA